MMGRAFRQQLAVFCVLVGVSAFVGCSRDEAPSSGNDAGMVGPGTTGDSGTQAKMDSGTKPATDGGTVGKDSAVEPGDDSGADPTDGGDSMVDAGPAPSPGVKLPTDGKQLSICYDDTDCKVAGMGCYGDATGQAGFCTPICTTATGCELISGIDATCGNSEQCTIDCAGTGEGDGNCPANMECREVVSGGLLGSASYRCMYPEGAGAGTNAEWMECDSSHGSGDCKTDLACDAPSGFPLLTNPGTYCASTCMEDTDCSVPKGITAVATCVKPNILADEGTCMLNCTEDGSDCPYTMTCEMLGSEIDGDPLTIDKVCTY